jgi:hypothetical protein
VPQYSFEDRERLQDATNQLIAREDWQLDPGTTHHTRINTMISPKCAVPTDDVFTYYSRIWNPDPTPENAYVPATKDSPWYIDSPRTEDGSLDLSFQEHMMKEESIKMCLNAKHNLSALELDGIGYCHLKFGRETMIKLIAAIFKDCVEARQMPGTWKRSRTALLYKKGLESEMRTW